MNTICPCFSCGKQISYMKTNNIKTDFALVEDAIEIDIYGSYGSIFDLSHMKIWICDDCIQEKMNERIVMINEDVNSSYEMEDENE